MLKYFVELFGTFVFLGVVFHVGQPVAIAVALLAVILLGSSVSGGHFNPAISFVAWTRGKLSGGNLVLYVLSQLIGGLLASLYANAAK